VSVPAHRQVARSTAAAWFTTFCPAALQTALFQKGVSPWRVVSTLCGFGSKVLSVLPHGPPEPRWLLARLFIVTVASAMGAQVSADSRKKFVAPEGSFSLGYRTNSSPVGRKSREMEKGTPGLPPKTALFSGL
jgi:hypothetical protein